MTHRTAVVSGLRYGGGPMSPHSAQKTARAADKHLRKRANTRARLIEAAADVVAAKGIAATRIDDVVSEAGFTRGAFYSNYSSLQEVLTEAIVSRANALMERVTATVEAMESPTMESLMEMLDSIRTETRAFHLLTSEYTLYRLRHPDSPQMASGREELTCRFSEIIEKVLARLGRRPTVSTTSLAEVICLLYLDSVVEQPRDPADSGALPEGAGSAGSTAAMDTSSGAGDSTSDGETRRAGAEARSADAPAALSTQASASASPAPSASKSSTRASATYEVIEAVLLGLSEPLPASQ